MTGIACTVYMHAHPVMKDLVPSIGSSTQTHSAVIRTFHQIRDTVIVVLLIWGLKKFSNAHSIYYYITYITKGGEV